MMNVFKAHSSVRIKGTENNYEPVQCLNPSCPNRNPHMHCPFCVDSENYHDPVILKAHYRVKHVDKGIDFAGLKILRCCEHCDIVGTIKGSKEFKGAHWHCYRCKNGFNRRDEAIKHYRTHFRNPETTFQIQIAQDVNQDNYESESASNTISQVTHEVASDGFETSSPLTGTAFTTITQTDDPQVNGKDGEMQDSVAANETVGPETIMIIQADEHLDASQVQNALNNASLHEVASLESNKVCGAVDHLEEIVSAGEGGLSHLSQELKCTVPAEDEQANKKCKPTGRNNIQIINHTRESTDEKFNLTGQTLIQITVRNETRRAKDDPEKEGLASADEGNRSGVELAAEDSSPVKVGSSAGAVKVESPLTRYAFDPCYLYGGYLPPQAANCKKEHQHPYFTSCCPPPPEQYRRSQGEGLTPSSATFGFEQQDKENCSTLRPYPYNPGFGSRRDQDRCRTSLNPLVAAYQQQNLDVNKGYLQYSESLQVEKSKWEQKLSDLQRKLDKSESEHQENEQKLKEEVSQHRAQVQSQAEEIAALRKREQELLSQLSIPLDSQIHQLLEQLKCQHEDLLHQQLAQIRRSYIQECSNQPTVAAEESNVDNANTDEIVFVQSPNSGNVRIVQSAASSDKQSDADRIVIVPPAEVENTKKSTAQDSAVTEQENSELVVSTGSETTAQNETSAETTEETVALETVMQVTFNKPTQQTKNFSAKTTGQTKDKAESKNTEISPRAKRRKTSH